MKSKLEELIERLCPDGVEYKTFETVCLYIRGITYNKLQETTDKTNSIKILRANNITLQNNRLNFEDIKLISKDVKIREEQKFQIGDILICAGSGSREHLGKVAYIEEELDYMFGGFMAVIRCNKELNSKFLYHIITGNYFKKYLNKTLASSTINNLSKNVMKNFEIPIPPIEIQKEIVRILDSFTELTTKLITELTTELAMRKQQYEYYRDKLLSFGERVEKVKIKDIALKIASGGTPKTEKSEYWKNGNIPWMSSGEINLETIWETEKYITKLGMDNSSAKLIPENSILIALAGQGTTRGKVARTRIELTTNQSLAAIIVDKNRVVSDYLFYYLKTQYLKLRQISSGNGTRGGLNLKMISEYPIPLPSLEEQQRIVDILDRFDKMVNDIKEGLPAEIEMRQKQYEYYRDKLLNFKRLNMEG